MSRSSLTALQDLADVPPHELSFSISRFLDRNVAVELGVGRTIHFSHSTGTEFASYAVMGDHRANHGRDIG